MHSIESLKKDLLEAIVETEYEKAVEMVNNWAMKNSYTEAFKQIFEPVLHEVGNLWYDNKLSLAQGYVTSLIAEEVFMSASKSEEFKGQEPKPNHIAVLGNIEDDYHSLGRKLIKIFLEIDGWKIIDLGNDVFAEDFVNAAVENNAKIIGVSAMMFTTAKNIIKVREELDNRKLSGKVQLAVGGAIFKLRESLCKEVGGDGTAYNAIEAQNLFKELLIKAENHK